jgi:hypothetical protein
LRSELVIASLFVAARGFAQSAPSDPPAAPAPETVVETPPTVVETPSPVVVMPPRVRRAEHTSDDEPMTTWSARLEHRRWYLALEVGSGSFADPKSIYKSGPGRGVVLGFRLFEFRLEQYDLTDRSGMFTNVAHGDGIASVTSLAARIPVASTEMIQASVLVGIALVSRPSMIAPDLADPSLGLNIQGSQVAQGEWGGGALLGVGVTLGGIFYVDARLYPTYWTGLSGIRLEYDEMTHTASKVTVTNDTSPGGIPITLNAGVGYSF